MVDSKAELMGLLSVDGKAVQKAALMVSLKECYLVYMMVDTTGQQMDTAWVEWSENSTVGTTAHW